jgi:hypothetical protein
LNRGEDLELGDAILKNYLPGAADKGSADGDEVLDDKLQ